MLIEIKQPTDNPSLNIVLDTLERNKQVIVFVGSKSSAERSAEDIAQYIKKNKIAVHHDCGPLSETLLHTLSKPTKQCERLARCTEGGIAFHHAGLLQKQKNAIEQAFRKGIITCICCTPTLCLSKDTKIWHDCQETYVKDMNAKEKLHVLSDNHLIRISPNKIEKLDNNELLLEINSINGYSIKVTPNHKMYIKNENNNPGIVEAKFLKKGNDIATVGKLNISSLTNPSIRNFVKDNEILIEDKTIDPSLSYFIGLMLGDGYSGAALTNDIITYKGSPCIVGRDNEIFLHCRDVCNSLSISSKNKNSFHDVPQLILGKNKWFREFLVRVGIEQRENKHISEELMCMKLSNIASLLKGLFDTDGWMDPKRGVGFSNCSEKLVKQMQKLLLRFGIISRIRKRKAKKMKIYDKEYDTLPSYELTILHKNSILEFYYQVGFGIQRKQCALLKYISKINSNLNYISCPICNYKIYSNLFSGKTKEQKEWCETKLRIINYLGVHGEISSKELKSYLKKEPRKRDLRLNHHYELISKKRIGNRSNSDMMWSLNTIGQWIYDCILRENKPLESFFTLFQCPLCHHDLYKKIKKGWRDSSFEGDIFWDKIKEIKTVDVEQKVYDVVLPNHPITDHMFVAEGFIVHNSMGVDLPAYRTVIRDLKRFTNWGPSYISVLEYHQMAGRAGRPGKDTRGEAITIGKTEAEKEAIYEEFITGEVEEIYSKLAVEPVLRTYVLSLIATEHVRSKQQIMDFFSKTFWAFQYQDMQKLESIINKMLKLLEDCTFIASNKADFTTALEYETESYTATPLGKRVAELYLDPLTADRLIQGMKRAAYKPQTTYTLLHLMCSQLELRPLLTIRKAEYEEIEEHLMKHTEELLVETPTAYDAEYDEFLKSIKTALFFQSWIEEASEEDLLKLYDVRPGELHAKKERADWIIYASAELAKLLQLHDVEKELLKLRIRVEQGVKEELCTLLKFEGIGRIRARKLYDNKIKNIGDVKKADVVTLTQILGPALAVSLKKQVGIDVEKIPVKENKRKGQISLMDY